MNKILIIAEAGVNHNGDLELAKRMIDVAAEAGVDVVKFQTFQTEKLVSKNAQKADYQAKNIQAEDTSQFSMLKKLELDVVSHRILIDYCHQKGIQFNSTAFDLESIELLLDLGVSFFKIPSGEITNLPYLKKIGALGKKVILSTGMADLGEIEDALDILMAAGTPREQIMVLHCSTEYPTPMEDVNLKAMQTIGEALKVAVGYSDHTLGIEIPIAAAALGAKCIEKHFTLDRNMEGPDHLASLEPFELKAMVKAIRNIETALGNGIKKPSETELKNKTAARKSIHLVKDIAPGTMLKEEHLIMKRPGDGISPLALNEIIGRTTKQALEADAKLRWEDLA
ncbi:N-acetylneuraminate synthase [Rufibacter soli]